MSISRTAQDFVAEAMSVGMDFSAPMNDTTPIEELRATLELLSAEASAYAFLPSKRTRLQLLEAVSTYLTSAPEDNECAICVTELVTTNTKSVNHVEIDYQIPTAIKLNSCGHVFHSGCLLEWLKKSNTCPFCRQRVCEEETKEGEQWDAAMS